jgi:hypothetical protein
MGTFNRTSDQFAAPQPHWVLSANERAELVRERERLEGVTTADAARRRQEIGQLIAMSDAATSDLPQPRSAPTAPAPAATKAVQQAALQMIEQAFNRDIAVAEAYVRKLRLSKAQMANALVNGEPPSVVLLSSRGQPRLTSDLVSWPGFMQTQPLGNDN